MVQDGKRIPGGGRPAALSAASRIRAFWAVPTYRFAASFLLYLGVIAAAFPIARGELGDLIHASEVATAHVVYHVMALFSSDVQVGPKAIVRFGSFSVTIIEECTGVYEALILGAALLAYPTRWRNTLIGLAIGIPMIYAMNVARIIVLLIVGQYSGDWFEFMHVYFWQVTMIAMIASAWMAWLWWVVRDDADPAPAG